MDVKKVEVASNQMLQLLKERGIESKVLDLLNEFLGIAEGDMKQLFWTYSATERAATTFKIFKDYELPLEEVDQAFVEGSGMPVLKGLQLMLGISAESALEAMYYAYPPIEKATKVVITTMEGVLAKVENVPELFTFDRGFSNMLDTAIAAFDILANIQNVEFLSIRTLEDRKLLMIKVFAHYGFSEEDLNKEMLRRRGMDIDTAMKEQQEQEEENSQQG